MIKAGRSVELSETAERDRKVLYMESKKNCIMEKFHVKTGHSSKLVQIFYVEYLLITLCTCVLLALSNHVSGRHSTRSP